MKFLILEDFPAINPQYLTYIQDQGHELLGYNFWKEISASLQTTSTPLPKRDNSPASPFKKLLEEIDGIIIRTAIKADKEFLENFPNLKMILRLGVGTDNIDLKTCEERGISVKNTPGANADSCADLCIRAILTLCRKLYNIDKSIENRFIYLGTELNTQTVGIVGFGNIGKKIYQRLIGFGVEKFLIFDPYLDEETINKFPHCKKISDKNEIFIHSDIISLHIPLDYSTRNFIGTHEFQICKKDVKLINSSRGGIIDENALYDFLLNNDGAGAFMDVWDSEPIHDEKISKLMQLNNFILTPHIGAMTSQANQKMHRFQI